MKPWHCLVLTLLLTIAASAQFKADVRLVEVYASVFDQKGNHVDGLSKERFRILDEGTNAPISSFETESGGLTFAILLDTTGSMPACNARCLRSRMR
jgi:hypothetical protein